MSDKKKQTNKQTNKQTKKTRAIVSKTCLNSAPKSITSFMEFFVFLVESEQILI